MTRAAGLFASGRLGNHLAAERRQPGDYAEAVLMPLHSI
jgi:hypothetical protein